MSLLEYTRSVTYNLEEFGGGITKDLAVTVQRFRIMHILDGKIVININPKPDPLLDQSGFGVYEKDWDVDIDWWGLPAKIKKDKEVPHGWAIIYFYKKEEAVAA